MKTWPALLSFVLCVLVAHASADTGREVEDLLARPSAPDGVLFEIVSGDADFLSRALPRVAEYADALRKRFPDLPIAVVSHGDEQFALTGENAQANPEVHETAKVLSLSKDIPVHVCGAYAAMNNVDAEAFPAYIDVVSQGPTQVRTYVEFGYEHIVVDLD